PFSSKLSVFCGSSSSPSPPLSATPRFSESLSVNHLSFKLRFLGLSKFTSKILIPSPIFFPFETSQEGYF
ncbi:hypothetical protein VIGAN_11089400, partial [Vigna angularis var. angularis]